ncbi:MAG TPA: HEAT repeat domain-containing protein [Planctomycetota bacterium]|nr:HEAT repeat domain-containing protein [Planctomycetota bacterium]
MILLALAFLSALPQQSPEAKPAWRRTLTLVNRGDAPLPAGVQVSASMPERMLDDGDASDVQVIYRDKPIPTWSRGRELWFRTAAEIAGGGRDAGYALRYGGGKAARSPGDVFEFFDAVPGALDPRKWEWSADLGFRQTARGLEVDRIPGGTNEYAPSSLIPRVTLPAGFVFEAEIRWDIAANVAASFALRADLAPESVQDAGTRAKAGALAKRLEEDDIERREEAIRELLKMGADAVPALLEATRSKDPEVRGRAAQVMSRLQEIEAPPAIRTGLSTGAPGDGNLDRIDWLGRSRSVLRKSYARSAGDTLSIARAEDGETILAWTRRRPVKVPGKVERVRIDFWSPAAASTAVIRIAHVIVRKYVELPPVAELGAEEAIR